MNRAPRGAHSLLVGLDGGDLALIERLGARRLPNLFAAMERGAWAAMRVLQPPATLPNWTTLLTALGPGEHGVFDFTTRSDYRVRFTGGSVRAAPTFAARLDALGKRCACLFFPATYPPERLRHGAFISGWDSPVAFSADGSFVWPPSLHAELEARFGPHRFDDVDEFAADSPHWHAALPDALIARIERRAELAVQLLSRQRWDLFAVYFGESDTASHHLWSLFDVDSPRHPRGTGPFLREALPRVYEALDRALGRLLEAAGGDGVELTVASDHGFGGASDKVLYLNNALEAAGVLRHQRAGARAELLSGLKHTALRRLPPRLREEIFRAAGSWLPSWLESRVRFGSIDMEHTLAFSDELNYFPAIHYNLRGRESRGQLVSTERARLRERIEGVLGDLRDPDTGRPVLRALHAREELYAGTFVERAPDLIVELELDRGYSYNVMPSASAAEYGPASAIFGRIPPAEYLGRKGRSLAGSHRSRGLFVAAGPQVESMGRIEASVEDAAVTVLARLGVAPPSGSRGRRLTLGAALATAELVAPEVEPRVAAARDSAGEASVAARLRALGYIE